jgi:ribonuclease HI
MAIEIYTDGGCRPNPGPGGWGVVILGLSERPLELSGSEEEATNNRMELRAAIEALRSLENPQTIDLNTDSQYVRQGITSWMEGWKRRGWRTASGDPVQNQDLWQELEAELKRHDVRWHWVKGHAGNRWNERADELASSAIPRTSGFVDDPSAVHIVLAVAYSGKMGRGAWAATLRFEDTDKELSGVVDGATANQMHILGAALALEAMKRPVRAHLYTASDYLKDGATSWLSGWRSRGWTTRDGKPVSNRETWQRLERQIERHQLTWHVEKTDDAFDEMNEVKNAARTALGVPAKAKRSKKKKEQ